MFRFSMGFIDTLIAKCELVVHYNIAFAVNF